MLELASHASTQPVQIAWIRGFCPDQATGRVDNLPFYFRARGDFWVFALAKTPDGDPIAVSMHEHPGYRIAYPYGRRGHSDAGFMIHHVARSYIQLCARRYLAQKARGEI